MQLFTLYIALDSLIDILTYNYCLETIDNNYAIINIYYYLQ